MPENKAEEKKEYAPLTPEQQKYVTWQKVWQYVYPALVLVAMFYLKERDIALIAGIGLLPYAIVTYLLSRKPSLVIVFTMQRSRREQLHAPENEADAARYRKDGRNLAIAVAVLAVASFVVWFFRRSRGA